MTEPVQQMVDQLIDQARREHPGGECTIVTSPQDSLLLRKDSDKLWRPAEDGPPGYYSGHVYRDCMVEPMGGDNLILLSVNFGSARYYGDLRTGAISTTVPNSPMWGDDVAAAFRDRILGDDPAGAARWPLSDWGSAQRVQASLLRQGSSGPFRLWPIEDVPRWLATVLDRCELYPASDVPGPTWAFCISRTVDWFALAADHPELDLTVPFDPAPRLDQIHEAVDAAQRRGAGAVLDLLLCPDTAATKVTVEFNGLAIDADPAAASEVSVALGGVDPTRDGPLYAKPGMLAWEWAAHWPAPDGRVKPS